MYLRMSLSIMETVGHPRRELGRFPEQPTPTERILSGAINQQQNGGQWNSLGIYSFIAGVSYTVTITSQSYPSSTCADAVKFVYLGGGGNLPPIAKDDFAVATEDTPLTINVISNDIDDGVIDAATVTIVSLPASGTAVANGNGTVTYTPDGGFTGTDTFTYTVADTEGEVSNQATVTVTVNAVSMEVVIDNGDPGTSFTGVWSISGAANPYGANSLWSRDGTTYTWTFNPTVPSTSSKMAANGTAWAYIPLSRA
jgi:hypothetical protein